MIDGLWAHNPDALDLEGLYEGVEFSLGGQDLLGRIRQSCSLLE
jgi:hypothetical protein